MTFEIPMPYDVVFAALDVPKVYDRAEAIGYGQRCRDGDDGHSYPSLYLSPGAAADAKRHGCFRAATRAAVRAFHTAGLAHGGRDDGPPGLRDYYGAFLFDPFGNRLETVCQHAGTD